MPQVQPELNFRLHLLIVFLGVIPVALSLVSMWKENHHGLPIKGIIWFILAIIGFCAAIALLADSEHFSPSINTGHFFSYLP
jgi:hypothetical protein